MSDSDRIQRCLAYVGSQISPQQRTRRQATPPTITLSRLTGSGGIPVAARLAEFLETHRPGNPAPWTVFHRTLVERVLDEHNLPAQLARYMPEDRVSYVQDTLEELLGLHPSSTSLVAQVTHTILGLAELGNCIIIGRGANVILGRCPTAFHVRLVSALDRRLERVQADKQVSAAEALEFIRHEDSARARYVKTHFDADIGDPVAYHLTVNTEALSVDEVAELIGTAVLRHFPASA